MRLPVAWDGGRDGGYKDAFEIALKFQCALYQLPPHVLLLLKALSQSQLFSIVPPTPHYLLVNTLAIPLVRKTHMAHPPLHVACTCAPRRQF